MFHDEQHTQWYWKASWKYRTWKLPKSSSSSSSSSSTLFLCFLLICYSYILLHSLMFFIYSRIHKAAHWMPSKLFRAYSFMMSLPAMSLLGLRLCLGSSLEATWLALGRAISILFGINGVKNQRSDLVGPPFPEFKACFSAMAGWHFSRNLTRRLLWSESSMC